MVDDKRVGRIWRQEGLEVPERQPQRSRVWLNDGSCIRLRPERRMLNVVDEDTREGSSTRVSRKLKAADVLDVPSDLFIMRGVPEHIRSGDGPESVATAVQRWIEAVGAKAATIMPGSPWENGSVESFDARLRDELLDGEIVHSLREAEIVIESWGRHDDAVRPHARTHCRNLRSVVPASEIG